MTESELFAVYFESITIVQANFEFWLTSTFAYAMAFHFAGKEMSDYFTKMLKILYILAVIVFFGNWLNSGLLATDIMTQIEAMDPNMVVRPVGGGWGPILIMLLMFFGSAGAYIFSAKIERNIGESET